MVKTVDYEFKVDKNKRKYALRVDLKTGKKSRIGYKLAKKRVSDNKYRRGRVSVEKKLKEVGAGATYKQYVAKKEIIEIETLYKAYKKGINPPKPGQLRGYAKKKAIKDETGIATRIRFAWTYTVKLDTIVDPDSKKLINICDSPVFEAYGLKINGDEFGKPLGSDGVYRGFVGTAERTLNDILARGLCTLDGGACVLLYDKGSREILKKFELGKGCDFSFDFKNYHEDTNILKSVLRRNKRL